MSWPTKKLGNLVSIKGGGTPSKKIEEYWNGNIPWASVKDLKSRLLLGTLDSITPLGVEKSATNIIPKGTIIVPTRMALGKVAVAGVDLAINQDLKALIIKDEEVLNKDYLSRFLESKAKYIESEGKGATVKGITLDFLKGLDVPLPPLEEQKRIAAILDKADAIRQKRKQAIGLTDEFLRSVFLDMFGDVSGVGESTVENLAEDRKGSMRTGPFGSQLLHSEFTEFGVSVLGIDNAVKNRFEWGKERFISQDKYSELSRYTVLPGDVLITIMGTCGRCALVPVDIPVAINTKHLCCITLDKRKCLPEFLHSYFLYHPIARRYLEKNTKGAIMAGLNMGIIKAMPVPVFPLAMQNKYVEIANKIESSRYNREEFETLGNRSFDSISQKAFSGQL
ncbi:TPA: restriction endonuclease subunit S [Vibrio diabolicus]